MEICSSLHRSLKDLKQHCIDFSTIKLIVRKVVVADLSDESEYVNLDNSQAPFYLEEKFKIIGLSENKSLAKGSPFANLGVFLHLVGKDGEIYDIGAQLIEYPRCCGSTIIKGFNSQNTSGNHGEIFMGFLEICLDIVGIFGYSTASYILSRDDNPHEYDHIIQIKKRCADISYDFVNKKTNSLCSFLIKNT